MSELKKIIQTTRAFKVNMGGILLDQALPHKRADMIDPFLLIHHLDLKVKAGTRQKTAGVGPHPHRGFIPVTFVFKGAVHHRDSRRNSSVVPAGGTQWMHSGRGIVHSERPSVGLTESGGNMEIIQFWVNVPKSMKMVEPNYVPIMPEDMPQWKSPDGKALVGVCSGSQFGTEGPLDYGFDVLSLRMDLKSGANLDLKIPQGYNGLIYILNGKVRVNAESFEGKSLLQLSREGSELNVIAENDTRAILLAAEPIEEPVATYGPFVMNTQTEIMEAMRDYQMGKMGVLIEDFD